MRRSDFEQRREAGLGRSQSRDSFAAVRYAVDTGSMPPQPKRSLWARKRIVLPVAAVTLLGAGFLASESRRQPDAAATLECTSARDVWRPACRPENLQDWVAKAASARDDAPAATGAIDDQAKRASTPKRVAEAKPETVSPPAPQAPAVQTPAPQGRAAQPAAPATEPAVPAKALPRVAAAPATSPEPLRKPEAAKPALEPVRAADAKPEPQPAVPATRLPEPQPAPPPVEPVKLPEPQPVRQAAKPVEPQPAAKAAPPVEQAAKPEPQPTVTAEPPRRPAPAPVKAAEEPASAAQAESKARQKRLAERAARREAAKAAERRLEPRVIVVRPDIEEPAPPRRLARVRPAEPGVRTTAHFPPGFVQALRHYNTRYAYGY